MTRPECAREQYTVNRYGARTGPSTCVEYRQVGTGLYADPDLYAAQQKVEVEVGRNMIRDTFRDMSGKNPMATGMRAVDAATSVGRDMDVATRAEQLYASPGLKRFQDNMMRFALGQPPLHLPGGETLASIAPKKSPDAPFKDSNYSRLVDDLIAENAQGWMLNRYVRGSASGVTVSSRDAQGRPSKIVGSYSFDSANGRRQGSVTVQFSDGLPQCVFFFDFPTTCRTPSRRIITAYESGRYRDQ